VLDDVLLSLGMVAALVAGVEVVLESAGAVAGSFVDCAYARPTTPTMAAAAAAELRVLETFTVFSFRREGNWP
jgi:hypothetical protein